MKKILVIIIFFQTLTALAGSTAHSKRSKYQWKTSTPCQEFLTGNDPVHPERAEIKYFICPDRTISHAQPKSRGFNGWEGYCGQTATSNVTSMLCQRHLTPKMNDSYGRDITPGQHSSTMKKSLNRIFSEISQINSCPKVAWKVRINWHENKFLEDIKNDLFKTSHTVKRYRSENSFVQVTPVPVLINSGGLNYHWVTLVDMIENDEDRFGCDIVVNTWGVQKSLSCGAFVDYADHTGLGERVYLTF